MNFFVTSGVQSANAFDASFVLVTGLMVSPVLVLVA